MKKSLSPHQQWTIALCALAACGAAIGADATALRCGWFENPTPANAWLTDRDGQWIIATQGGHQAQGDWPDFKAADWVRTGAGSYGYGCACMRVEANAKTRQITRIVSAAQRPLAACRTDPAIKHKEPENPLKSAK